MPRVQLGRGGAVADGEMVAIREAGAVAAAREGDGREFRVVLVREGLAKSGRYFTRRAVEDVARQANGARAFADHPTPSEDRERPVRSVRDVVGVYAGCAVEEADGKAQATGTLRLMEHAAWLASLARESVALGGEGLIGLSIDSLAVVRVGEPAGVGRRVPIVESVPALKSVDVVTRASAGGGFLSVREAEMVARVETEERRDVGWCGGDPGDGRGVSQASQLGRQSRRECEAVPAERSIHALVQVVICTLPQIKQLSQECCQRTPIPLPQ